MLNLRFINDTAFAARGTSFKEANEKLLELMNCLERALDWSTAHHADFKIDKTFLI